MADTKIKIPQVIIKVRNVRLAFARIHKAEARIDKKSGQPRGKPKFSATLLFDPSNEQHAAQIKEIKTDGARILNVRYGSPEEWPKPDPEARTLGLYYPWGLGNKLPKPYDGFKDMWFLKLSDTNRPLLGNRSGKPVVEGDDECPYSGCYVDGRISLWYFDNESAGLGCNFRSLQYNRKGDGFGGGGSRSADDEFEALGDTGGDPYNTAKDPFDIG